MKEYLPEGIMYEACNHECSLRTADDTAAALSARTPAEAVAMRLNAQRNLVFDLNGIEAVMPRAQSCFRVPEEKLDAVLVSLVGRPLCFYVTGTSGGVVQLSRALAQRDCLEHYIKTLQIGDIIRGRVRAMQPFGAFVDIGRGITALLPTRSVCMSRIEHPQQILCRGQDIFCAVRSIDEQFRVLLTLRELLGSFEENAARFQAGDTAAGTVRAVEPYGIFVELAPNLTGLAEPYDGLAAGDAVSVYIKSIIAEKKKIKLAVISKLDHPLPRQKLAYTVTSGQIALE